MAASSLMTTGLLALVILFLSTESFGYTCYYVSPAVGGMGGYYFNDLFNLTHSHEMFEDFEKHDDEDDDHHMEEKDHDDQYGGMYEEHEEVLRELCIRAGSRVDAVTLTTNDGKYSHGGPGGESICRVFASDEYVSEIDVCVGKKPGTETDRIFYLSFKTSKEETIEGGTKTDDCTDIPFPEGYKLLGTFGRSGAEIDLIGFIFTKQCW